MWLKLVWFSLNSKETYIIIEQQLYNYEFPRLNGFQYRQDTYQEPGKNTAMFKYLYRIMFS